MELMPGYKHSEVGVIPDDWVIKSLSEVSWFQEGPGLRNWQFTSSGMKVINVTNLENGVLNLDRTDRHISLDEFNQMYRHFAIDASDIVMASSGNSYCKVAVVRDQDLPLMMNTSVIRFKPSKLCDYGFLWALLASPQFKAQIDLMITGGAQPNFGPYHLKRVVVPLPSLIEQHAIATALNDVDALLATLDQVIAKKRDLKQAAMQQLLTGKTRLPGFSGEWEVKRLGEVCRITTGKKDVNEGHPDGQFPFFTCSRSHTFCNVFSFDTEAILIAGNGDVGNLHYFYGKFEAYQRTYVLYDFSIQVGYLWQQLNYNLGNSLGLGKIGSSIPYIKMENLTGFEFGSPVDTSEQTAIATVLSDMDAELSALEARRDKTRNIKQAMMQELLTGQTRLV